MSTTGQRLAALSGLSGGSAAVHLRALASGLTAADLLVARSGLGTGSAMQHLMAEGATGAPVPRSGDRLMGVHFSLPRPGVRRRMRRRRQEEFLMLGKR